MSYDYRLRDDEMLPPATVPNLPTPAPATSDDESENEGRYCHLQNVFCRVEQERDEYRLQRDLHMAAANKAEAERDTARQEAAAYKMYYMMWEQAEGELALLRELLPPDACRTVAHVLRMTHAYQDGNGPCRDVACYESARNGCAEYAANLEAAAMVLTVPEEVEHV